MDDRHTQTPTGERGVVAAETEMKTRDSGGAGDGRSSKTNCSKIVCGPVQRGGGMACMDMEWEEGGPGVHRAAAAGGAMGENELLVEL